MSDAAYHDLSAIERDALLGAATADATVADRPHKGDVHARVESLRGGSVSKPSIYTALDRLADAGFVRIDDIDGRSKAVSVTGDGVRLLDHAGDTLTNAAYANTRYD